MTTLSSADAPLRPVDLPPVDLTLDRHDDGTIVMAHGMPLQVDNWNILDCLAQQAEAQPDKVYLAERDKTPDGVWQEQSFAQAKAETDAIAQCLINLNLEPGSPVMILSGNSIAHGTIKLGAMAAGYPVCPVSANYALLGDAGGFARLKHVVDLVKPAVIFAEQGGAYANAVTAVAPDDVIVISRQPEDFSHPAIAYEDALATEITPDVDARIAALNPESPAAYMLTSGSTGRPKAVIQTHRMLASNLYQVWHVMGRASGWDKVMLDWLPWSHVSGAFAMLAAAVFGGSLYIDGGKPLPGLFDETVRNLRERPLRYFSNVPAGYAMLADALEADEELRKVFFSELRLMLYGGAGLPQPLYDRIQAMAVQTIGHRIFFTTGYGATETSSGCMAIYFDTREVGIGLPLPGLQLKMVPLDDRYELRIKGPMVMPGYLDSPAASAAAFDNEGFYRTGDTARFHDPQVPEKGLTFAGRLAEEFKLTSGTWVAGGILRAELLKRLVPYVADLLVCGVNRSEIAILAWPNMDGLASLTTATDRDTLLDDPAVRTALENALNAHNEAHPESSARIARFAFLAQPPSAEAHEVSDKGTVNQSLALERRASDVAHLYADPPPATVLVLQVNTQKDVTE